MRKILDTTSSMCPSGSLYLARTPSGRKSGQNLCQEAISEGVFDSERERSVTANRHEGTTKPAAMGRRIAGSDLMATALDGAFLPPGPCRYPPGSHPTTVAESDLLSWERRVASVIPLRNASEGCRGQREFGAANASQIVVHCFQRAVAALLAIALRRSGDSFAALALTPFLPPSRRPCSFLRRGLPAVHRLCARQLPVRQHGRQ